jgi:hypothetical protein
MSQGREDVFTAPVILAVALFVFAMAIVEKGLNIIGTSLPFLDVYPRQLLDWVVVLLILDIALSLRQMLENRLYDTPSRPSEPGRAAYPGEGPSIE